MEELYLCLMSAALIVTWTAGVVLAAGFWGTTAAICFPPSAWYLLIERCMQLLGMVS